MKRHRERGGKFTKMMAQPFYARALLGSEEGVMEAQRLRIRGVFQADRVGSLPTEETGSSVVYAQRRQEAVWSMHRGDRKQCGLCRNPSTRQHSVHTPRLLTSVASHLPKDLLSLTLFRLHAGRNSTGRCSAPSLG